MRKAVKNNLLEIFKTIYEAHEIVKGFIDKKEYDNAQNLLADCQDTAIQLGNLIEESEGEGFVTVSFLEEYCEALYEVATNLSEESNGHKVQKQLDKKIIKAENSAKNDIKVKLEIVFMPYKASMWDSLESVWKAADEDPDCDAYVVPIPYYDRKSDHSFGEFHYEGGDYPDYVPVVHYESYNLEQRRPDVIYIHNPYDGNNYVTSVAPRFYSFELKKYTECLVYVPYHISGTFLNTKTVSNNIPSAFRYVDKIVLPSYNQKDYYVSGGVPKSKFIVCGSPKLDFVINAMQDVKIPDRWMELVYGKKVVLLNSTISKLLKDNNWANNMLKILSNFEGNDRCVLIWRPHPLLKSTIYSMRPYMISDYDKVVKKMSECKNVIIDTESSVYPAMKLSDALISDYSSIVMQYSVTGKPALLTVGTSEYRNKRIVCFDYFSNYFIEDGVTVDDFINMICECRDERRDERIRTVAASVLNTDGSCGCKLHKNIKEFVLGE